VRSKKSFHNTLVVFRRSSNRPRTSFYTIFRRTLTDFLLSPRMWIFSSFFSVWGDDWRFSGKTGSISPSFLVVGDDALHFEKSWPDL